jgi:hypothetical protein
MDEGNATLTNNNKIIQSAILIPPLAYRDVGQYCRLGLLDDAVG